MALAQGPADAAVALPGHLRPISHGLDDVAAADSILAAIRATPGAIASIVASAGHSKSVAQSVLDELRGRLANDADTVTAVAAVHALAELPGRAAARALADLLRAGPSALATHAAWSSVRRWPTAELLEPLVDTLGGGGLAGMHAQATLARWALLEPWLVAAAIRSGLARETSIARRTHFVETMGLIPDDGVLADLTAVVADAAERDPVRIAAIAAFGDRPMAPLPGAVPVLALGDGRMADAARLAIHDRAQAGRTQIGRPHADGARGSGTRSVDLDMFGPASRLRIAQVHLGAALDPELRRSGMGDTGGIATLLVKLGLALENVDGIDRVTTIARGTARDTLDATRPVDRERHFAPVALEPESGTAFTDPWPARVEAERGIRRVIRELGRPDVLHLRMADAGTLAAANVAATLGIPTVFTLAPDPHGIIAEREAARDLSRRSFAREDAKHHFWYRVQLVDRLTRQAHQIALFPRARLQEQLRALVGVDVTATPARFTVVPEGIDVVQVQAAIAARSQSGDASIGLPGPTAGSGLAHLLDRIAALPSRRHGLPIVLSVGRLNEMKGMARLAQAFAADAGLRARATLVIVGGDLDDPTPAEATELARIHAVIAGEPDLEHSLILLGHRPNGDIPHLLAAARLGVGRLIGPDGAYACASRKEEFGLAIVEAMAAGLAVVAPLAGGPATYIEEGRTGHLVDTPDVSELNRGVVGALELAGRPGRAAYASEAIARRYDISSMAETLSAIYARVAQARRRELAS